MKVIATQAGYYGGKVRYDGQEFEVQDGETGSWFEPVEQPKKPGRPARSASDTKTDAPELI